MDSEREATIVEGSRHTSFPDSRLSRLKVRYILGVFLGMEVFAWIILRQSALPDWSGLAYLYIRSMLLMGFMLVYSSRHGGGLRELIGRLPQGFRLRAHWKLLFIMGCFCISMNIIIHAIAPKWSDLVHPFSVGSVSWMYVVAFYVFLIGMTPLWEELAFRGVLLHRWTAKWSLGRAILASSLVFLLGHPYNLIGSYAIGVIFSLLYIRTGSLLVTILLHGLYNLIASFVMPFLLGLLMGWFRFTSLLVPAVLIAITSGIWLTSYARKLWHEHLTESNDTTEPGSRITMMRHQIPRSTRFALRVCLGCFLLSLMIPPAFSTYVKNNPLTVVRIENRFLRNQLVHYMNGFDLKHHKDSIQPEDTAFYLKALSDPNLLWRRLAVEFFTIAVDDPEALAIIAQMATHDPEHLVRWSAAQFISERATPEVAIPILIGTLASDSGLRSLALTTLNELQALPDQIIPAYLLTLEDPDPRVRALALAGLGGYLEETDRFLPTVRQVYETDPDPSPRRAALRILAQVNQPLDQIQALLLPLVQDPSSAVFSEALRQWFKLEFDETLVIPTAILSLQEMTSFEGYYDLLRVLEDLGHRAEWALPALREQARQNSSLAWRINRSIQAIEREIRDQLPQTKGLTLQGPDGGGSE